MALVAICWRYQGTGIRDAHSSGCNNNDIFEIANALPLHVGNKASSGQDGAEALLPSNPRGRRSAFSEDALCSPGGLPAAGRSGSKRCFPSHL